MPALRYAKKPKIISYKRSEVNPEYHKKIDVILKGLRSCSQRFGPSETFLNDELRILDRLYYKGCNQHRSALFWRKVQDMRRMGSRLVELHLQELTDSLRNTFYSDETLEKSSKLLKGAWCQVPGFSLPDYVVRRTRVYLQLFAKARERFVSAQMNFTLMMQTGAFLQLILTLTALVARLDCLAADIQETLHDLLLKSQDLSRALSQKDFFLTSLHKSIPSGESPAASVTLEQSTELVFVETDDPMLVVNAELLMTTSSTSFGMGDSTIDEFHAPTLEQQLSSTLSRETSSSMQLSTSELRSKIDVSESKMRGKDTPDPPVKKKKKKRNEIDEIFGSL